MYNTDTACILSLLVRDQPADHRMSNEKVFISLQNMVKMYDIWTPADCPTLSSAKGILAKVYWDECGRVCIYPTKQL